MEGVANGDKEAATAPDAEASSSGKQQEQLVDQLRNALKQALKEQSVLEAKLLAATQTKAATEQEDSLLAVQLKEAKGEAERAKKQKAALEQKVKTLAAALEKRIQTLNASVEGSKAENDELKAENARLSDTVSELEDQVQRVLADKTKVVEQHRATERQRSQSDDLATRLQAEVATAHRETAEANAALAECRSQLSELQTRFETESAGRAMSEDERNGFKAALSVVSAEKAAAVAEAARYRDQLRQVGEEGKRAVKVASAADARAAAAEERRYTAEAALAEMMRKSGEAQGMAERLKEEGERRAKAFNSAVKAAVGRMQQEWEEERAELVESLDKARLAAEEREREVAEKRERERRDWEARLLEAQTAATAEAERLQTKIAEAQEALTSTRTDLLAQIATATAAASNAQQLAEELRTQMQQREAQLAEEAQSAGAAEESNIRLKAKVESLARELADAEKRVVAAQETAKVAQAIAAAAAASTAPQENGSAVVVVELEARARAAEARVRELEQTQQLAQQQQQRINVLEAMGLDSVREERLRWDGQLKQGDIESVGVALMRSKEKRPPTRSATSTTASTLSTALASVPVIGGRLDAVLKRLRLINSSTSDPRYRGTISMRSALLLGYLVTLHIMVMTSYANHPATSCVDASSEIRQNLPGFVG
eukprot:jgi/Chlat1/1958/Chrsp157S00785